MVSLWQHRFGKTHRGRRRRESIFDTEDKADEEGAAEHALGEKVAHQVDVAAVEKLDLRNRAAFVDRRSHLAKIG